MKTEVSPIIGRTLVIKCIDLKTMRQWSIRSVGQQAEVTRTWADEDEPERKKKFMDEVAKRTKKAKKTMKQEQEADTSDTTEESISEPSAEEA